MSNCSILPSQRKFYLLIPVAKLKLIFANISFTDFQTNRSWLLVLSTLRSSFNPRKSSFTMAWRIAENESTNTEHRCVAGIRLCRHVQGLHHRHCLALLQILGNATTQSEIYAAIHNSRCIHPSGECYASLSSFYASLLTNQSYTNWRKETTQHCYLTMMRPLLRAWNNNLHRHIKWPWQAQPNCRTTPIPSQL